MSYSIQVDQATWCVDLNYRNKKCEMVLVAKYYFGEIFKNFICFIRNGDSPIRCEITTTMIGSKLGQHTKLEETRAAMIDTLDIVKEYFHKKGCFYEIFDGQN